MIDKESETLVALQTPAVLFADVSGWVDLVSRKGDEGALTLRDTLFGSLKEIVSVNRGWIVKTIGDELMCLFDSAEDAARASCVMQRHASEVNRNAAEPLSLRMGFHAGRVVLKDGDVEGNTVNVAARVTANSSPERILLTRETAELLPTVFSHLLRPWRTEALKGKEEPVGLMELQWRSDTSKGTVVAASAKIAVPQYRRLTLRCQGQVHVLESGGKPLTFGRSVHNELVIDDSKQFVSGSHGRIDIRGGSIVLTDNSRNGIYVSFGNEPFHLVQKTVTLRASGLMALGRPPHETDVITAEFELE